MDYIRRVVDGELDDLLPDLAAISLDGPKGVGKTATASRRADVGFRLDNRADHEILDADLTQLDRDPGTVLLNEWQRLPRCGTRYVAASTTVRLPAATCSPAARCPPKPPSTLARGGSCHCGCGR